MKYFSKIAVGTGKKCKFEYLYMSEAAASKCQHWCAILFKSQLLYFQQLPADVPRKTAEYGPSTGAPANHMEVRMEFQASSFGLVKAEILWALRE